MPVINSNMAFRYTITGWISLKVLHHSSDEGFSGNFRYERNNPMPQNTGDAIVKFNIHKRSHIMSQQYAKLPGANLTKVWKYL